MKKAHESGATVTFGFLEWRNLRSIFLSLEEAMAGARGTSLLCRQMRESRESSLCIMEE